MTRFIDEHREAHGGEPICRVIKIAPCPLDHVNRQFRANRPNVLWVSDRAYVSTWSGFVNVAFIIDALARRIMLKACLRHDGWRVSRTALRVLEKIDATTRPWALSLS